MKGPVAFLVNVDFARKAKRFNITARKSQREETKKEGLTRSAYMVASSLAGAKQNRSAR